MAKILNTRIVQKHDIEANWKKAENFIPLVSEIIVYDPDEAHAAARFKIGDGETLVNDLPFANNFAGATYGFFIYSSDITDKGFYLSSSPRYEEDGTENERVWTTEDAALLEDWLAVEGVYFDGHELNSEEGIGTQFIAYDIGVSYTFFSKIDINKTNCAGGYLGLDILPQYIDSNKKIPLDDTSFEARLLEDKDFVAFAPLSPKAGSVLLYANQFQQAWGSAVGAGSAVLAGDSVALGNYSFAVGRGNTAGYGAAAFGFQSIAFANHSFVSGTNCNVEVDAANGHAEGHGTVVRGIAGHAEGHATQANREYSHAEGQGSVADHKIAHAEGEKTTAAGISSHSEGKETKATAQASHAEGVKTIASGYGSHAEGIIHTDGSTKEVIAAGSGSHAEGRGSQVTASGIGAHAEGTFTIASHDSAHAEGWGTEASGAKSHAQGHGTKASGKYAHAEGLGTKASSEAQHVQGKYNVEDTSGTYAHIVGWGTSAIPKNIHTLTTTGNAWFSGNITVGANNDKLATENFVQVIKDNTNGGGSIVVNGTTNKAGLYAFAEGGNTWAKGHYSHAEGYTFTDTVDGVDTSFPLIADGAGAHAEGQGTQALAQGAHSEGAMTVAQGMRSHAEGFKSRANANYSHAEGALTQSNGIYSHAEGNGSIASGQTSHAEGISTNASGQGAHAEGNGTNATSINTHAEGNGTTASGSEAHAEGWGTTASGPKSHAEGHGSKALGKYSHAEGLLTIAKAQNQHVAGRYNLEDPEGGVEVEGKYAYILGNGKNNSSRSNAHTVDWNGNAWFAGNVTIGAENKQLATEEFVLANAGGNASIDVDDALSTTSTNPVQNQVITNKINSIDNNILGLEQNFNSINNEFNDISQKIINLNVRNGDASGSVVISSSNDVISTGNGSFIQGENLTVYEPHLDQTVTYIIEASGEGSHAEGQGTKATARGAHAEGYNTFAMASRSHTEGGNTKAHAEYSHAEGIGTITGVEGDAEIENTSHRSRAAHAEGVHTIAKARGAHSEGFGTIADRQYQHVQGKYNETGDYAHIVGNGSAEVKDADGNTIEPEVRSNAYTLDWNGNATFAGSVTFNGTNEIYTSHEITFEFIDGSSPVTIKIAEVK